MTETRSGAAYQGSSSSSCLQARIPAWNVNVTIKIGNKGHVAEGVPSSLPAIIPTRNVNVSISKINASPPPPIAITDLLQKYGTIKEILPVATPSPTFLTPKPTARMPRRYHQMKGLPAPASLLTPTPRKDLHERGPMDATAFNNVQIIYIHTHFPNVFEEDLDFTRASDTFIYECLCSNGIFT